MTIRERFIPYTTIRTYADPTVSNAFHCPTRTEKPRQPTAQTEDDSYHASTEDLERFRGFVFEPPKLISNSEVRRLRRMAMYQSKTGTR
ncbi:hypothetical protein HYU93_02530 [Candidatus Daviesbacteria bacterium]|nr:hypothetical protein [Candidatus Daviesbacteria bacterium]